MLLVALPPMCSRCLVTRVIPSSPVGHASCLTIIVDVWLEQARKRHVCGWIAPTQRSDVLGRARRMRERQCVGEETRQAGPQWASQNSRWRGRVCSMRRPALHDTTARNGDRHAWSFSHRSSLNAIHCSHQLKGASLAQPRPYHHSLANNVAVTSHRLKVTTGLRHPRVKRHGTKTRKGCACFKPTEPTWTPDRKRRHRHRTCKERGCLANEVRRPSYTLKNLL